MVTIYVNGEVKAKTENTFSAIRKIRSYKKKYKKSKVKYFCDDIDQQEFIYKNL